MSFLLCRVLLLVVLLLENELCTKAISMLGATVKIMAKHLNIQ